MFILFFATTEQGRFEKWKIGVELPEGIIFGTKKYFDFLEQEKRRLINSANKIKKEASAGQFSGAFAWAHRKGITGQNTRIFISEDMGTGNHPELGRIKVLEEPWEKGLHGPHVTGVVQQIAPNSEIFIANYLIYGENYDVTNLSLGTRFDQDRATTNSVLENINQHTGLFVTSAGNNGVYLDETCRLTSCFDQEFYASFTDTEDRFLILAGNLTNNYLPEESSNLPGKFDNIKNRFLWTLGSDVLSTSVNNSYERATGTSIAAPIITGASALIHSYCTQLVGEKPPPWFVAKCLLESADRDFFMHFEDLNMDIHIVEKVGEKPVIKSQSLIIEIPYNEELWGKGVLNLRRALEYATIRLHNPETTRDQIRKILRVREKAGLLPLQKKAWGLTPPQKTKEYAQGWWTDWEKVKEKIPKIQKLVKKLRMPELATYISQFVVNNFIDDPTKGLIETLNLEEKIKAINILKAAQDPQQIKQILLHADFYTPNLSNFAKINYIKIFSLVPVESREAFNDMVKKITTVFNSGDDKTNITNTIVKIAEAHLPPPSFRNFAEILIITKQNNPNYAPGWDIDHYFSIYKQIGEEINAIYEKLKDHEISLIDILENTYNSDNYEEYIFILGLLIDANKIEVLKKLMSLPTQFHENIVKFYGLMIEYDIEGDDITDFLIKFINNDGKNADKIFRQLRGWIIPPTTFRGRRMKEDNSPKTMPYLKRKENLNDLLDKFS